MIEFIFFLIDFIPHHQVFVTTDDIQSISVRLKFIPTGRVLLFFFQFLFDRRYRTRRDGRGEKRLLADLVRFFSYCIVRHACWLSARPPLPHHPEFMSPESRRAVEGCAQTTRHSPSSRRPKRIRSDGTPCRNAASTWSWRPVGRTCETDAQNV